MTDEDRNRAGEAFASEIMGLVVRMWGRAWGKALEESSQTLKEALKKLAAEELTTGDGRGQFVCKECSNITCTVSAANTPFLNKFLGPRYCPLGWKKPVWKRGVADES